MFHANAWGVPYDRRNGACPAAPSMRPTNCAQSKDLLRPFVELRVRNLEGEVERVGRPLTRWRSVAPGSPRATSKAPETRDCWTRDGWFRAGDIATIDSEGYVKLVDRGKDAIISGGE